MTDAEVNLRSLLQAAIEVVSAFGSFLERDSSVPTLSIKRSESELPFSKATIKKAIAMLQEAIRHSGSRTVLIEMLPPAHAQQILSSQFAQSLEVCLVMLDSFVAAEEVEAERKKHDEVLEQLLTLANDTDSDALCKLTELLTEADPAALERVQRTSGTDRWKDRDDETT